MDNIAAGASLEFDAATSGGQTVTFAADTGNLVVALPSSFAAVISGFALGNEIDLIDTIATAASYQSGALQISDGGTTVASLNLSGSYSGATFEVATDGNGGTLVTIGSPPVMSGDFWKSGLVGIGNSRKLEPEWGAQCGHRGRSNFCARHVHGNNCQQRELCDRYPYVKQSASHSEYRGDLKYCEYADLDAGTVAVSGTIDGGNTNLRRQLYWYWRHS